jgi:hypothetical protein
MLLCQFDPRERVFFQLAQHNVHEQESEHFSGRPSDFLSHWAKVHRQGGAVVFGLQNSQGVASQRNSDSDPHFDVAGNFLAC